MQISGRFLDLYEEKINKFGGIALQEELATNSGTRSHSTNNFYFHLAAAFNCLSSTDILHCGALIPHMMLAMHLKVNRKPPCTRSLLKMTKRASRYQLLS